MIELTRRSLLKRGLTGVLSAACGGGAAFAAWLVGRRRPPRTFSELAVLANPHVKPARYWRPECAGVQCTLCPFQCFLPEGTRGICRVRMCSGGKLWTLVYGHPVAVHVDPMEKKPVFHMLPGSLIYSLAAVGCNLRCSFCQNWEIAQSYPEQAPDSTFVPQELRLIPLPDGRYGAQLAQGNLRTLEPAEVVRYAQGTRCRSVAFTYSEPAVFFEYVLETAKLAKKAGLRNVMVSGGYINPEPLAELAPYFDVVKIDLKGFSEDFYRKTVGGELRFVLRTLTELKRHRVFSEIVNLVVPGLNDDPADIRRMCKWVKENLGPDVPLFFSRFMPQYQLANLPTTPVETLTEARNTAIALGLHYVYVGNVAGHDGENTYCPRCRRVLIRRYGFAVQEMNLKDGRCPWDGTKIPGIWS
ncbi:MAG: AmmeMemoRadiSam system radical SAM enzyme [Elusimicrobia bacterium]|nr:AmmeMemoRadiSam system radical SAM enzyme [Elusimicrobiota bacterium]